jgi:hypothetical protein
MTTRPQRTKSAVKRTSLARSCALFDVSCAFVPHFKHNRARRRRMPRREMQHVDAALEWSTWMQHVDAALGWQRVDGRDEEWL